ncbi:MAG: FkbM family methyltransferase [Planctomycetes bacterium]|nr:FkbM family methyltransferase [Planctomycetota bacterium]
MNRKKIARDVFLRKFQLERSYRPSVLLKHPDWNYTNFLALVVAHVLRSRPNLTFLQVGAFDGLHNDALSPIAQAYGLRGIIVEPQPGAFERLKACYAGQPQIALVNAAIANENGMRDFYTRTGQASPLASFSREHLLKHKVPPDQIVCQQVRCCTLVSLLKEHGFDRLDLLQIDAEGYDYEVIRTIDFSAIRPAIIRFEHVHLSSTDANACVELLASQGYRFIVERRDLIALIEH